MSSFKPKGLDASGALLYDITVIDDTNLHIERWLLPLLAGDSALAHPIQSVADMVSHIEHLCSPVHHWFFQGLLNLPPLRKRVQTLTIIGHGNETGQQVGNDWICYESLKDYRSEFVKLTPLFGDKGEIILGGCRVGRAAPVLLGLSDIVGRPVSGYSALQRPHLPGYEGGRTTCFLTCTREGFTTADKFDEVQLRLIEYGRALQNAPPSPPVVVGPPGGPRDHTGGPPRRGDHDLKPGGGR